jgi:hypothetical protein
MMKKISRELADQLIQNSKPAESVVERSGDNLNVTFNLINGVTLSVRYNRESLDKTYYIKDKPRSTQRNHNGHKEKRQ